MGVPLSLRGPILIAALAVAASAGAEDPAPANTWYAQALARGVGGLNVTHFWSQGAAMRAETVVAGHKVVTIVKGEWYYAYDALTGQGLAIQRAPETVALDKPDRRPFGREYEILVGQGAELVGEEELLGRPAGVYRVTDRVGRRELWVTEDADRIPLRIEIFDRESAQRRYTDYLNWQSGLHIPDGFFEPDPRVQLERMTHADYLRRSADEGAIGPVPVFYTSLLFTREED